MQNIKLVLAYDGTAYLGWQKTHEGPSIEGELQKALETILQHPVHLQAASRTDAGVHAAGQVVNFLVSKEHLDLSQLQISLNSLLPKDISALNVEVMAPGFHPTVDCIGKEYRYYLCYGRTQLPMHRHFSWHYPAELDVNKMRLAAKYFMGQHDFSAFCNFRKQLHYHDHIRCIESIDINILEGERLCVRLVGNHFLYKMARNIVGTLVYVGKGKIPVDAIEGIIASQDRTQAGVTAPAHGLFLHRVLYSTR